MLAAFDETIDWVNADKRRAAQAYLEVSKENIALQDLSQILLAPDYIFGKIPHRVGAAIDMLHKAGMLKSKPTIVEGTLPRPTRCPVTRRRPWAGARFPLSCRRDRAAGEKSSLSSSSASA